MFIDRRGYRYVGSIILGVFYLLVSLIISMLLTNREYPFPMDAIKSAHLAGSLIGFIAGNFILSAIFTLIFFAIKRYILKHKNNTFYKPFVVMLVVNSLISLIITLNSL